MALTPEPHKSLRRATAFAAACLAALVGLAPLAAAGAAELIGVRFGPDKDKTRIVVDMMGEPAYAVSGVADGAGEIHIEFNDLALNSDVISSASGRGHVRSYRFSERVGGARAVFALKKTAKIKELFLLEPKGEVVKHRLVIDLETADEDAFLASLPARYPDLAAVIEDATAIESAPVAPAVPAKRPSTARRVIVVDAGHGGRDPGAIGQKGALEKTVNLKAALKLKEILESRDRYEVVLTRAGDDFVRPDKREALARAASAALFISLHADAISDPSLSGGSVYTLSKQGTSRAARIAKSEGDYQVYDLDAAQYGEGVSDILFDLAQNATNTASGRFAELLIDHLTGETPLLNRSHRTGDLRVLLAPDVPAVLFEMAFISNAEDEANLTSEAWRARAMTAVADAIDAYFEEYGGRRFAASAVGGSN